MTSKKSTTIAVLRYILGTYDGQEEIFAATVGCSVSWVKKVSSGQRSLTPKTASKVSIATGVSEKWLIVGDPKAPILERDDATPYTQDSYARWREKSLTPSSFIEPGLVAAFTLEITKSLIAANEVGRMSTAVNDLWKFSKAMKSRYGVPEDLHGTRGFTRILGVKLQELAQNELSKTAE